MQCSKSLTYRDFFDPPCIKLEDIFISLWVKDSNMASVSDASLTLHRALFCAVNLDLDLARAFLTEDAEDLELGCL